MTKADVYSLPPCLRLPLIGQVGVSRGHTRPHISEDIVLCITSDVNKLVLY